MKVAFTTKIKLAVVNLIKSFIDKIFGVMDWNNVTFKQVLFKRRKNFFFFFFFFFFFLYTMPRFLNFNKNKTIIEERINELFDVKSIVKGKVSYLILPRPTILLRDVEIKLSGTDEDKLITIPSLLININVMSLFSTNLSFSKVVAVNPVIYYNNLKNSKQDFIDRILKESIVSKFVIKNGKVVFSSNNYINGLNFDFNIISNNKIKIGGSFKYLDAKVKDILFNIVYTDKDNYKIIGGANYQDGTSKINSTITFKMNDSDPTIYGKLNFVTNNLSKFISKYFKNIQLPNAQFFEKDLNIKADIQNSRTAILVNNGIFEGVKVTGKFKGELPFLFDDSGINNGIDKENILFNIDLISLNSDKLIKTNYNVFNSPMKFIESIKPVLNLLKYARFKISAKNVIFKRDMVKDFKLETSPIFYNNEFNGLNIEKLFYSSGSRYIDTTGKILNLFNDDIDINVRIKTTIPQYIKNRFTKDLQVNSFDGDLLLSKSVLNIKNAKMQMGGDDVNLSFVSSDEGDNFNYDVIIKSDKLDLDKIFNKNINFAFILSNLSKMNNSNFNIKSVVNKLKINGDIYNNLKLSSDFVDGDLSVKKLSYTLNGYDSSMNGKLIKLFSSDGMFDNFNYIISSQNLKGVKIPFIRNSFLERMIANGVKKISVSLNGLANNPVSNVDIDMRDVFITVSGRLLDSDASYSIKLKHNNLKGFLFSWGYITDDFIDYFYDDIPFIFQGDVVGNNIHNVKINIKENELIGNIFRTKNGKEFDTSLMLRSIDFDLKHLIKRLKNTQAYINLFLKMVRKLPINILLEFDNLREYDNNLYRNVKFDFKNFVNPGRFIFKILKNKHRVDLDTEIVNSSLFEGKLKVTGYDIPNDLLKNDILTLKGGVLNIDLNFKTNGDNVNLLFSNLSGEYNLDILKGQFIGISDYNTILSSLFNLSNITTNNIIYTIEHSLQSGKLNFDKLSMKGNLELANVNNSAFRLQVPNINIEGMLTANLIQKSINIDSVFNFSNLASDILQVGYNLTGFVNKLTNKVDLSSIVNKVNPVYIQKKKKDLLN